MSRFTLRERLPDRQSITRFVPNKETRLRARFYAKFALVIATFVLGATAAISGFVLLLLMALAAEITGIVISAGAISLGVTACIGSYIWITTPA